MVIFIKGAIGELDYFINHMALEVPDSYVLDVNDKFYEKLTELDSRIDEHTRVITFNNLGISFLVNDRLYWKEKNVKLYNIMVDHPAFFIEALEQDLPYMHIITIDRNHKKFVEKYFPNYKVDYLPHGGSILDSSDIKEYDDREISLLYVGSSNSKNRYVDIEKLPEPIKSFYALSVDVLKNNPQLTMEELFEMYLKECDMTLPLEDMRKCINFLYQTAMAEVRGYYQQMVIEEIAKKGITIDVYGSGWEELATKYPDSIRWTNRIPIDDCMKLIGNSKIVLNIQPWFRDGAHERIYNTMLNDAVCISEDSIYLSEKFVHGENIVLYNYNEWDELTQNIEFILNNPDIAKELIARQKIRVHNSTWRNRLDNIINGRFNAQTDFI